MEILIACNDQAMALRMRAALHQLGIDCPIAQVLSHDSAKSLVSVQRQGALLVVFFGSSHFNQEDLSLLSQLNAGSSQLLKIVAVGSNFTPTTILQAVRSGAVDCLDINNNFETELQALIDRIKLERQEGSSGKLFAIVGSAGGVGASVFATNLAVTLAQKDRGCCLLDLQLRGGDLATLLKTNPKHNLLSLASKADQLDKTMFEQSLTKHECGIHLLASMEPFSDYRRISMELTRKIVHLARSIYPHTVADLEDCIHPEQVRTLAEADFVIVLLRSDYVSLYHTKRCLDHLRSARVSPKNILLVANRIGQPKEIALKDIEEALKFPIACCIPNDPESVNISVNLGVPVVVSRPKAKIASSIVQFTDRILGLETAPQKSFAQRLFSIRATSDVFAHALSTASSPITN